MRAEGQKRKAAPEISTQERDSKRPKNAGKGQDTRKNGISIKSSVPKVQDLPTKSNGTKKAQKMDKKSLVEEHLDIGIGSEDDLGSSELEEDFDDAQVTGLDALGSASEDDEFDQDDELSGEDSVVDSDEDNHPQGMWSEDEDDEDAKDRLTAANIEGLSMQLDQDIADEEDDADLHQEGQHRHREAEGVRRLVVPGDIPPAEKQRGDQRRHRGHGHVLGHARCFAARR